MKLDNLKQLVKVNYITEDSDGGGPDFPGSTVEQINQADFDKHKDNVQSSFWREIAKAVSDERIYKVTEVTKL
jgi:hypothetical protein